tara:strand:- start:69 stop:356 length:288 start_codon:yes stop_codon:yes gene_type:complete
LDIRFLLDVEAGVDETHVLPKHLVATSDVKAYALPVVELFLRLSILLVSIDIGWVTRKMLRLPVPNERSGPLKKSSEPSNNGPPLTSVPPSTILG